MQTEPEKEHIGLIGAGLMGTAIAERLLAHGYQVSVWNRSRDKTVPLIARGAAWCDHPLAACERVIISLYSSEVVEQVLGDMWDGLHPGQIVLDTTTGEPDRPRRSGRGWRSAVCAISMRRSPAPANRHGAGRRA